MGIILWFTAYQNVISENPVSQDVSASYINSWKKVLSDNTDWILWAASRASKAIDYILDIKGDESTVEAVSAEVETVENSL